MAKKSLSTKTSQKKYIPNIEKIFESDKQLTTHLLSEIKLYHNHVKIFEARIKMLRKAGVLPQNTNSYEKIKSALSVLASKTEQEVINDSTGKYNDIKDYIFDQVAALTSPQMADYLQINYSKEEQNSIATRMWLREATVKLKSNLRTTILQLLSQAEDYLKISIPGQINNVDVQPVSFGYYMVSYATSMLHSYKKFCQFNDNHNSTPASSGSIGGTSLVINSNILARYLQFSAIKKNAMEAIGDDSHIMEFMDTAKMLATRVAQFLRQMRNWSQQHMGFINFIEPNSVNSTKIRGNTALSLIDSVMEKAATICNAANAMNSSLFAATCPLSKNYRTINSTILQCFEEMEFIINAVQEIFFLLKVNKRLTKEAAQDPKGFHNDIFEWLLKNTKHDIQNCKKITQEIINKALSQEQKISLMTLEELQEIEPDINQNFFAAVSPVRSVVARRSTDATSPVKVRKYIRHMVKNVNSLFGEENEEGAANGEINGKVSEENIVAN